MVNPARQTQPRPNRMGSRSEAEGFEAGRSGDAPGGVIDFPAQPERFSSLPPDAAGPLVGALAFAPMAWTG